MTSNETYAGEFYCVKCKEKREAEGRVVVSENGRRMAKAVCPVCGTNLTRILGTACSTPVRSGAAPDGVTFGRGGTIWGPAPSACLWTTARVAATACEISEADPSSSRTR